MQSNEYDSHEQGSGGFPRLKADRVQRACDICRRRKIKCSGATPDKPCNTCTAAGSACTFEERTPKRASPKGYVESLERRLETMESLLRTMTSEREISNSTQLTGFNSEYQSMTASGDSLTPTTTASDEVGALVDDLDALELSTGNDRYVGRGSGLHLVRSVRAYASDDLETQPGADQDKFRFSTSRRVAEQVYPSLVESLLTAEVMGRYVAHPLPPADLFSTLIDAYFKHVNEHIPILHRPSFDRNVVAGLAETDKSFRVLIFSVLALGARFVQDSRLVLPEGGREEGSPEHSRGWLYFRACYPSMSPFSLASSLFDLQSSTLSVMWLLGSASPLATYAFVGMSMRRIIDVGAHREHRLRWTTSPLENQLRKRAFFTLYGMDRTVSGMLGRPLALQDEDTDITEPMAISDEDLDKWDSDVARGPPVPLPDAPPTSAAVIICLASLAKITGLAKRIFAARSPKDAASHVFGLDSMLNAWLEQVPHHLRWNPAQQDPRWLVQSAFIYSSYLGTQILIHRDFISPNTASLHSFPSLAICSNAARSTSHVLDLLRQKGHILEAFMFAPIQAVTSGLILLISVFANGETQNHLSSSALSDVKRCIDCLKEMSHHTFIAAQCHGGLSRLSAYAASPMSPLNTPSPSAPASASNNKRSNPDFGEASSVPPPLDFYDVRSRSSSNTVLDQHPNIPDASLSNLARSDSGTPSIPRTARVKSVAKRHRQISAHTQALPLTTTDLSHTTFRGDYTYAPSLDYINSPQSNSDSMPLFEQVDTPSLQNCGAPYAPQLRQPVQQNYQPDYGFRWQPPANSYSQNPPPGFAVNQPMNNYALPSPNTEALFNSINHAPGSTSGMFSPGRAAAAASMNSYGFEYPFNFQTAVPISQSDNWESGFTFDTFTQSFVPSGMGTSSNNFNPNT